MDRGTLTWIALMAATAASWVIGHGSIGGPGGAAVAVVAIAMAKVRFVGLDFMELRHAPVAMRIAFELWLFALGAVLAALYLW